MSARLGIPLVLIFGVAIGVGVVVACGNGPGTADAGGDACTCPPAEPPLAGRIVREQQPMPVNTGQTGASAICSPGGVLLGGGCDLLNETNGVYLQKATPASGVEGYYCLAQNTTGMMVDDTLTATAICLYPPQ